MSMMKRNLIVVVVFGIIEIIIGITTAYFTWVSTNTDVIFTIGGATITYEAGNNITGISLRPVSCKEVGVQNNIAIEIISLFF